MDGGVTAWSELNKGCHKDGIVKTARDVCHGYSDVLWLCLQELQTRLSDEIGKLRSFISSRGSGDRASHNNERSSCELEVRGCPWLPRCLRPCPSQGSSPLGGFGLEQMGGGDKWSGAGSRTQASPPLLSQAACAVSCPSPSGPSFLFHRRACARACWPFQGGGS